MSFRYSKMTASNNGTIIGTIVSPISHKTPTGELQVVEFRIAPLDMRENDSPIPATAYNGVGQAILDRYNQGDTIAVEYRLRYNTWQTEEGEYRSRMEVVLTSVFGVRLGKISSAKREQEQAAKANESKPKQLVLSEEAIAAL